MGPRAKWLNQVLGILRARGSRLDFDYLHEWVRYLRVEDLSQRALDEVPER